MEHGTIGCVLTREHVAYARKGDRLCGRAGGHWEIGGGAESVYRGGATTSSYMRASVREAQV